MQDRLLAGDDEEDGVPPANDESPPAGAPFFLSGRPAPPDKPGFVFVSTPAAPGREFLVQASAVVWE